MNVRLRDYQINGIEDIMKGLIDNKSVLFQMPTGTGKTTLFCEIVKKFTTELYSNKKVLIITHRKELVVQVIDRLGTDFHLTAGVISSNFIGNQSSPIQVASIQTLVRRDEHQKDIFSLVIIDEAHHALASTYRQLWNFYPSSKFLGVTATPIRTNGEGFHDLFDKLITTASIKWFIKNDYLSDQRYFASHTPDVSNISIRAGDYDETELSEVMLDNTVMADLVQSYIDFAIDKKMIVFAVNRAHCSKIAEKFNSNGFAAKAIDTFTPTDERKKIVDDFRNNKFKILCNVNIFTEGFDCPDVDAVQLARPTKSLTLFLQQVGRCMRPHQNKQYGIVLDNAGLWKEHGLPKMDRNWSLNGMDKNICPSQKEIIGIKEISTKENNEPQESKGIRLVEFGELDNLIPANTIDFNNIEKNLTDKKITVMRERIETLVKKIQKFELHKSNETDEEVIRIFDENINKFKQELFELQEKLQPERFEQVIELIIGKCHEMIDSNDIFVDGDRDIFLNHFVEPYLKSTNFRDIRESAPVKSVNRTLIQENLTSGESQSERNRKNKNATFKYQKINERKKFSVTFPDGTVINNSNVTDTFLEAIKHIGPEKIVPLNIISDRENIVSDKKVNDRYKNIGKYWINTHSQTKDKKDKLNKISERLNLNLKIEYILE